MRPTINFVAAALLLPLGAAQNTTSSTNTTTSASEAILSSGEVSLGDWADAYAKAAALVAQLTNEEKITIITGGSVSSVNWTALEFKDGTQGVQGMAVYGSTSRTSLTETGYDYVTGFAESSALAMTWDKTLMYDQLKAVALEFYGKGFQVTNGPTSQPLGRTPWGGRLVETLGQDPYLNGIGFGIGAKAFSDAGIVAGGKHFLLNEQETNRQASGSDSDLAPYSSVADDKTMHETYLW